MESNLLQFSTLLFSNLEELKHFAILKKRRLKGGLSAFNSWDELDLFFLRLTLGREPLAYRE